MLRAQLEQPMQPLSNYDLVLNIFVAVVLPLLILANLTRWGTKSAMNTYLWRENPQLMKVSLVVIGLLALFSMVQLAAHYGLISMATANIAMPIIAIPFAIAGVAEIWLAVKALRQYLRARRSQA
jgi:hypothetical protein